MSDGQEVFRRVRFEAVVAQLLDAHEAGARAGVLVDILMDAAPLLTEPDRPQRDWTSTRTEGEDAARAVVSGAPEVAK